MANIFISYQILNVSTAAPAENCFIYCVNYLIKLQQPINQGFIPLFLVLLTASEIKSEMVVLFCILEKSLLILKG